VSEDCRPIDYWLKHLDALIEGALRTHPCRGRRHRRQGQVLNTLHDRPSMHLEIAEALKPFLVNDPEEDRRMSTSSSPGDGLGLRSRS